MAYANCDNLWCDLGLSYYEKGTEKHLEQIPGSPNLAEMKEIALKCIAHILRKAFIYVKKLNNEQLKEC